MKRFFKAVHFTVVTPEKKIRRTMTAPAGNGFHSKGIEAMLSDFADKLGKAFPGVDFRLVPLGPNRFNFIHQACDAGTEATA